MKLAPTWISFALSGNSEVVLNTYTQFHFESVAIAKTTELDKFSYVLVIHKYIHVNNDSTE